MLKKQKSKNYAELENARVFHNPKTDLIEITGKYVDGGNFSVVLPQGTKSDIKVRTEIAAKNSHLNSEALDDGEYGPFLPIKSHVIYDRNFSREVVQEDDLWHDPKNKHEVFYFPLLTEEPVSKFPLGVGMDRNPIFVDLESHIKNNVFISATPGRGGLMSVANLFFHVLNYMPETDIICGKAENFFTMIPKDEERASRVHILRDLFLLDHLRQLHHEMKQAVYGAKGRKEVIFLDGFEQLIDGDVPDIFSIRTTKAVRAEVIDLILEISKINRSEFSISFVFVSPYISDSMNAFLDTAGTIIAFPGTHMKISEVHQYKKIFGSDLQDVAHSRTGTGFIKSPLVNKKGEAFDTFVNQEVIESFSVAIDRR